jgi:hemerythrin-like metal-binding protein
VEYTVSHFSTEERFMQGARYPEYSLYKRQHEELTRQVLQIKAQVDGDSPVNTIEVMNFLKNWLVNHILGSDKKLGQYIIGQRKAA